MLHRKSLIYNLRQVIVIGSLISLSAYFVWLSDANNNFTLQSHPTYYTSNSDEYTNIIPEDISVTSTDDATEAKTVKETLSSTDNDAVKPVVYNFTQTIKKGQFLSSILARQGISSVEILKVSEKLSEIINLRTLQPGYVLKMNKSSSSKPYKITELSIEMTPLKGVRVVRNEDNVLSISAYSYPKEVRQYYAWGVVTDNLYESANKIGLKHALISEFVDIFNFSLDFQRDIKNGDSFSLYYDTTTAKTHDKKYVKYGPIGVAELQVGAQVYRYFRFFSERANKYLYFDENGVSARRGLLKTPLASGRISSKYGKRLHPILGFSKLHSGVDFSANKGTQIFAAGDGVVERVGWNGNYGNYVRIRHSRSLKTAYAHLLAPHRSIKKGVRVTQKQVIGYVGSTGLSTGNHLHYETIYRNKKIDPNSLPNLPLVKLTKQNLVEFKKYVAEYDLKLLALQQNVDKQQQIRLASDNVRQSLNPN